MRLILETWRYTCATRFYRNGKCHRALCLITNNWKLLNANQISQYLNSQISFYSAKLIKLYKNKINSSPPNKMAALSQTSYLSTYILNSRFHKNLPTFHNHSSDTYRDKCKLLVLSNLQINDGTVDCLPIQEIQQFHLKSREILNSQRSNTQYWMIYKSPSNSIIMKTCIYCKNSNISRTMVGNKIVDHSDVIGAVPIGAAPTTSSFSTQHLASMDWAKTTVKQDERHLSFGIWCDLYLRFDSVYKNKLRPQQNGHHSADDIFRYIFSI